VVDERFDIPLLRAMSEAHPEWQLCIVGPVVKIPQESLPRAANIHLLRPTQLHRSAAFPQRLGCLARCFSLGTNPRDSSAQLKTLEYMAAERPIVSTSITDVVKPYSDIV